MAAVIPFQIHRRIPFIRRPFYQRDEALRQRDELAAQFYAVTEELSAVQAERRQIAARLEDAEQAHRHFEAETVREYARAEKAAVEREHAWLQKAEEERRSHAEERRCSAEERRCSAAELTRERALLEEAKAECRRVAAEAERLAAIVTHVEERLLIVVTRGDRTWSIDPDVFETFGFRHGDKLHATPPEQAAKLPTTWGDLNIPVAPGRAIRMPSRYEFFEFKGFHIPAHLIALTGAGPETFDLIGRRHIELYNRFCGISAEMTVLDVGCGIGRVAFQLLDVLSAGGKYIGIDVTRDSVLWCQENITARHPNFQFHHFDAVNELYNPHGKYTSLEFTLPMPDQSVDRIFLASVFTHLLENEVLHYMSEFARVLKPDGQVYATFFLHTPEALAAARHNGTTPWQAKFDIPLSDGVYANDPVYPRGAVAFTDAAMRRLIGKAGLCLVQPYLKGSWSGLHDNPDDGQDVAILARADR